MDRGADDAAAPFGAAGAQALPSRRSRDLLAVFGVDDRIDCPRYPTYPFAAVGQVLTLNSNGEYLCSGTLIGPDVVLTAAHCTYSLTAAAFYSFLDFAPGRYRSSYSDTIYSPYGAVPWVHVTTYSQFVDPSTTDPMTYDIAVIKLGYRIGERTGWMGLYPPCTTPDTWFATTAGYPTDWPLGSCVTAQCVIQQTTCVGSTLYHKCATYEGQSGSAMWVLALNPQIGALSTPLLVGRLSRLRIGPYIRAVHNLEWTETVFNPVTSAPTVVYYTNSAVSITPTNYAAIKGWIAPSFANGEPEVWYTQYPVPSNGNSTDGTLNVLDTLGPNPTTAAAATPVTNSSSSSGGSSNSSSSGNSSNSSGSSGNSSGSSSGDGNSSSSSSGKITSSVSYESSTISTVWNRLFRRR